MGTGLDIEILIQCSAKKFYTSQCEATRKSVTVGLGAGRQSDLRGKKREFLLQTDVGGRCYSFAKLAEVH